MSHPGSRFGSQSFIQITGPGWLLKTDPGTLVLQGTNTYSGGTTLSMGTLQLGDGGTSGSISGDVANTGTLVFDRADGITFGGVISGTGALEQQGTGETILTAANTYTGATTVNAGTLVVNGSLLSAVTVNAGGTLSGSGSVGATTVNSGGTLSPGSSPGLLTGAAAAHTHALGLNTNPLSGGRSSGTLTVNGALAFQPGSTYQVAVTPTRQSSLTAVNGKTMLNGGTVNVPAANGVYAPHTTYTILSSSGGVSGTFADVTSNLAFLMLILDYEPDDVLLKLNCNDVSFGSVAQTSSQAAVDNALQRASQGTVSNNGWKVLGAIESLNAADARTAFDSLSGEGVTAVENLALLSSDLFLYSLHDQSQLATGLSVGNVGSSSGGTSATVTIPDPPSNVTVQ